MDGAARTSGQLRESFTVDGKTYTLRDPGYLAMMEEAEAHIVAARPNPLVECARAISSLPDTLSPKERRQQAEVIQQVAEGALLRRNRVGPDDIGAFLHSRSGLIFTLYQFCPEIKTLDQAEEVLTALAKEIGEKQAADELQAKMDTVSGAVEAKNSSGPDPKKGPGESESTD